MCGIWCEIGNYHQQEMVLLDSDTRDCLCRRGPDHMGEWSDERCHMVATVLHMCSVSQCQPIVVNNDDDTIASVLIFNGEIYSMQKDGASDSCTLYRSLNRCTDSSSIVQCLTELDGPWSLIYYQHEWHELQSGAIHILDLSSVDIWQTCQSYSLDRQFGDWDRQFTTFEHFPIHRWLPLCKLNRCNSSDQSDTDIIIDKFIDHLSIALATRLVNANVKGVGILFSGGVDSLLIAAITNRLLDSQTTIDLINVAFDRDGNDYHRVPDRITGINAYQALIDATPSRHYRFIEVNVDRSELQNCRQTSIRRLLSPTITVLDDSIGCVLWFGARGAGCLYPTKTPYRSHARILLIGSGADELMGGYGRHRTQFERHGIDGLVDELEMDIGRIGHRNLGRDDRCIADHGRESRLPYLDEQLVTFVNSLEINQKIRLDMRRGIGDKWLIRESLRRLEMPIALTELPKRAMQFGTKIAKLESRNEKGSDRCDRLYSNDIK